ncbi:MAG: hypothetical protein ACLTOV_12995 [Phocaeicola sp.]
MEWNRCMAYRIWVLLLAEQYMAWWWAAALSLGCTIFFSILMGRKKK